MLVGGSKGGGGGLVIGIFLLGGDGSASCEVEDGPTVEHPIPSSISSSEIGQSPRFGPSESEGTLFDSCNALSFGCFDVKFRMDVCIIQRDARVLYSH